MSKVLTTLGVSNRALGFVGGFAGDEIEGRLLNEGIPADFVRISEETRTNIIINELSSGNQAVFSAGGPEVQPYELLQLVHKVERLEGTDMVVISGSLPPGISPEIYRKLVGMAKERGARAVLDADGQALKVGISALPGVIKPNVHELSRLVGKDLNGMEEVVPAARGLQQGGIAIVLVSMGPEGILLVSEKETYLAAHPAWRSRIPLVPATLPWLDLCSG